MLLRRPRPQTGHDAKSWPVLLLLIALVLLPTAGVLWFMNQAMGNEQLAVRQKLSDIYQAQLHGLQQALRDSWQARSAALDGHDPDASGDRVFAELVRANLADSVVVYNPKGHPAYPASPVPASDRRPANNDWRRAERLEHSGQSVDAAAHYATIAKQTVDRSLAARALLAQARCLVQAQQTSAAIKVLADELSRSEYHSATDAQGRLITPNAQLRALELIGDQVNPAFQRIADALAVRLRDYDDPTLPATQRRFLMTKLVEKIGAQAPEAPDAPAFDTLAAERLAWRYLESDPPAPPATSLQPSGLPEVWHLAAPSGKVVALFHQRRLLADFDSLIARQKLAGGSAVALLPPGTEPEDVFGVSLPAGGFLRGWQIVLRPEDQALFVTAANQRIKAYRLIGVLGVVVILILTILVARAVERKLALTRLKNDLLATVSHELKTPLASMRLLVDTLLETGIDDKRRVQEYLQLIAKENVRLSRLVDNFLTFSRMEQNQHSFEKEPVPATAVIEAAAASVADRFSAADCRFEVHIAPGLPLLMADHDALVTVLLNLLDNAYKYTDGDRHIRLRGYREEGQVCFAVRDNGIGLSNRVAGKIFDRFYQVDQSLSRPGSGCGLGLSIVRFIVQAHGGSVDVESQPDVGSTFIVRLPIAPLDPSGPAQGRLARSLARGGGPLDVQ